MILNDIVSYSIYSQCMTGQIMLMGALANQYNAQLIDSIDTRITDRTMFIAGGVHAGGESGESSGDERKQELARAAKRRNLPKLLLS